MLLYLVGCLTGNTLSETHCNNLAVNFTSLYTVSMVVECKVASYENH